jgi:hypothetical protein
MSFFNETVFPFATLHPNASAQLKAKILFLHPTLRNHLGENHVDLSNVANAANSVDQSSCAGLGLWEEEGEEHSLEQGGTNEHGALEQAATDQRGAVDLSSDP